MLPLMPLAVVVVAFLVIDFLCDVPALKVSAHDARGWDIYATLVLLAFCWVVWRRYQDDRKLQNGRFSRTTEAERQ